MKRLKKSIVTLGISAICLSTVGLTLVACNEGEGKEPSVTFVTQPMRYYVGENIDCCNFIQVEEGISYTFTVTKDGKNYPVLGRTFYADKSGEYTLKCTAKVGEKTVEDEETFIVYDTKPFALITDDGEETYASVIPLEWIEPVSQIVVDSDTPAEILLNSVTVYKNPYVYEYYISGETLSDSMKEDVVEYDFDAASADGFFDGENVHFIHEGYYVFDVEIQNAGGSVYDTYLVNVIENLKGYEEMDTVTVSYDYYKSEYATWQAVEGAASYRVKVDYENVMTTTENCTVEGGVVSFKVNDYLCTEYSYFQSFDLVVIPLDAQGKQLKYKNKPAKITCKNVSVAPDGQKYAQFGLNSTVSYNPTTEVATVNILGQRTKGLGHQKITETDNGYVAWKGDFGVGYYVDFTFVGNNIPNVCLFADKINGDMSKHGGQGILVISGMNGLYKSGGHYKTLYSDSMVVFGPERMNGGTNAIVWDSYLTRLSGADTQKFTQDYLSKDVSGTRYRYVVGSYLQGEYIYLDLRLYDASNPTSEQLIHNQHVATNVHISQVSGGNIIAFAPLKENAANSSFTFKTPYQDAPIALSGTDASVLSSGATFNADGSVTLKGYGLDGMDGSARMSYIAKLSASYIAWEGEYGTGNYVEFEFTGNNMPQVCFFADKINGSLTGYTTKGTKPNDEVATANLNKGLLLQNGIFSVDSDGVTNYESGAINSFRIWGPYRISPKSGAADNTFINLKMQELTDQSLYSYVSVKGDAKNAFVQGGSYTNAAGVTKTLEGLAATYKNTKFIYRVGTYEKDGNVYVDATLKNAETEEVVAKIDVNTGLLAADNYKGSIIAYAAGKGANRYNNIQDPNTTFQYKAPEKTA